MDPLPPGFIKIIRQNTHDLDCAVATLAMLFGVNYEQSLAVCVSVDAAVLDCGLNWTEIQEAADMLGGGGGGVKLVPRGRYDIEEATGILNVKKRNEDHVVFLWAGRIIEGNGELWLDPDDYLRHYGYKAHSLLVRTK